jgi:hypothetical protein
MLDIGCGNLRGGWRFIDYLDSGNCYGIDISPDILIAARKTRVERGLQDQLPQLTTTGDLVLDFLPDDHFDVVHAHRAARSGGGTSSAHPCAPAAPAHDPAGRTAGPDGSAFDRYAPSRTHRERRYLSVFTLGRAGWWA